MSAEGLGWHVISGEQLLAMLRRVHGNEDPDLVYVEEYVNAAREYVPSSEVERGELIELLRRAASLFPVERPEWGGDPDWVASIKREVAALLDRDEDDQ